MLVVAWGAGEWSWVFVMGMGCWYVVGLEGLEPIAEGKVGICLWE